MKNIKLYLALFVLLLGVITKCKAQYTYDNTEIYIDGVVTGGAFSFDRMDASIEPGINTQLGFRFRDESTELYVELLGGYNSMTVYELNQHSKQYYANIDFNVGVYLTRIISLKVTGFYLFDNNNTSDNSLGIGFGPQVDIPIAFDNKLKLTINGTLGTNVLDNSRFGTLIKGNIGLSYEITAKDY